MLSEWKAISIKAFELDTYNNLPLVSDLNNSESRCRRTRVTLVQWSCAWQALPAQAPQDIVEGFRSQHSWKGELCTPDPGTGHFLDTAFAMLTEKCGHPTWCSVWHGQAGSGDKPDISVPAHLYLKKKKILFMTLHS